MTEFQRLFCVQARTDFVVFSLLRDQAELPACHALHYLQMATELLGKAHAWKHGPCVSTHRAFVGFLRSLSTNRKAQKQLGYEGQNESWRHLIRKASRSPNAPRTSRLRLRSTDPIQSIRGRAMLQRSRRRSMCLRYGTSYGRPLPDVSSLIWPAASSQQPTLSCERPRTIVERRQNPDYDIRNLH